MMKNILKYTWTLLLAVALSSCEKPITEDDPNEKPLKGNLTYTISRYETMPLMATAGGAESTPIAEVANRINLAAYDDDGNKVKAINQTADDEDFGTLTMTLEEGHYTVVILAHSCTGNATMSNPNKITFPNNKVTDTFYFVDEVTIGGDSQSREAEMRRGVAQFRLQTTDPVPENVAQMKFYYTGGSSTFDAISGYGCVDSRQTELRPVDADIHGKTGTFSVYTFPHAEKGELHMTVTALDAQQRDVASREFTNVPIARNQATIYSGAFFDDEQFAKESLTLTTNEVWQEVVHNF